MKKLIIGLALAVLVLAPLAACGAATTEEGGGGMDVYLEDADGPTAPGVEYPAPTEPTDWSEASGADSSYNSTAIDEARMIIRNGEMSLVVTDIAQTIDDITALATEMGGYVVSSHVYGEEEEMRGWISFRVPDESFEAALSALRAMSVRVESESTSSQDVTEAYIDLQARLANAEATEQQYLALLDKAEEVEDILNIYNYLTRIRQEIEQLKGQIQYLEQTTSTSLISVSLEPEEAVVGDGWSALEVLKSAARGLVTAGKVLGTIAIWLLIFIPIWGTILGIILWRRHKRKAGKKAK
jgi:hypothetical protein